MTRLRALLATLRIANAPSVVSNVWLGFMVGWIPLGDPWDGATMPWNQAITVCLAGLLLYFAGNLANDWFDRHWDAVKRPERALPSGLFNPSIYILTSVFLATVGVAIGFMLAPLSGGVAIVICSLIATYTYFHKRAMWSVIPMGLCRAGLYFLGFFASRLNSGYLESIGYDTWLHLLEGLLTPLILSVGLFAYIVGLTLSARYEGMPDAPQGPKVISLAMLIVPIMAMSCQYMDRMPLKGMVGILPFAIWLALCLTFFRKPIPRYVSGLLAGIPLVDFIAAAPIALGLASRVPQKSSFDVHEFPPLLALLLIPLIAFALGRLLQKVAPAT